MESNNTTGQQRAEQRLKERREFTDKYYANTVFPVNTRAEKRRMKKLIEKHQRAMEVRQRFSRSIGNRVKA